jgi:hypothetical protein
VKAKRQTNLGHKNSDAQVYFDSCEEDEARIEQVLGGQVTKALQHQQCSRQQYFPPMI